MLVSLSRRLKDTQWILLAAALWYSSVLSRFYVGYLSDDARDILAARSLLSGHYASWYLPGHPATNFPLPGFPLLLLPCTLFFFKHPAFFRCIPYLLTLACIPLFNALIKPWLDRPVRLSLLLLFSLNPTTLVTSGRVIADAPFMAVILGAFFMLRRALQQPGWLPMITLGSVVGWAAILRPEGILLLPAMAVPLFQVARRKSAGFFLFGTLPLLIVSVRNYAVTGAISGYGSIWQASLPMLTGHYGPFLKNMSLELCLLCTGVIGGCDFNIIIIPLWAWVMTGLISALIIKGLFSWAAVAPLEKRVLAALILYSAGFFFLHAVWLAMDEHYLWPLLPLALVLGVKGFAAPRRPWRTVCGACLMTGFLCVYTFQYVAAIRETQHKPLMAQFPEETFVRLLQSTPKNSFILTPNAPLVALYTGRYATAYVGAHNEDEFRYRLLDQKITHILVRPARFLFVQMAAGRSPSEFWAQVPEWIAAEPSSFVPLYANAAEEAQLYAVQPSPNFYLAFQLYLRARDALDKGQTDTGLNLLESSFQQARLPAALNAYATACLIKGNHLSEAQAALQEALRQRPQFASATLNLARVYSRLKDQSRARHYFDAARAISLRQPNSQFLLAVIDREEGEMR